MLYCQTGSKARHRDKRPMSGSVIHLNMRRSGLQAKHKGELKNNCQVAGRNTIQDP